MRAVGSVTVLDAETLDFLTETVVARLLVERQPAPRIARDLALRIAADRPDLPALALALPFTLAAAAIDEMLGAGTEARTAAQEAWRIAALIGADALMLRGQGGDTLADLTRLWAQPDEVFGP